MGKDVYDDILYKHWPFPTAFSTASWLLNILLPEEATVYDYSFFAHALPMVKV